MEELDLVPVYTPEGALKKIKRSDVEKALGSGFSLAEQAPIKKQSYIAEGLKSLMRGGVEAGKYLGEKSLETAEDVTRLGAQGATFGLSDEALAATQAVKEGEQSGGEFADLYQKYLALQQEEIKKSKERSPILGTVAEFGGALVPAIGATVLSGGLAAPAAGAGLANILGRAAITGAAGGAAYGFGTSEGTMIGGDKEKIKQLGSDVVGGALSGAATGPLFAGAAMGIGKLAKGAKGAAQKLATAFDEPEASLIAFEESKAGTDFTSKAGKEALGKRLIDEASDITERIIGVERSIGNELSSAVDNATERGVKISISDISSLLNDTQTELLKNKRANTTALDLLDNIRGGSQTDVSGLMGKTESLSDPRTLKKFRDEIKNRLMVVEDDNERAILNDLQKALRQKLEQNVDGFAKANKDFELFRMSAGEQILNRGLPQFLNPKDPITRQATIERVGKYASDLSNKEYKNDLLRILTNDISKAGRFGESSEPARRTMTAFRDALKNFEQQTGRDLSKYKLNPDEVYNKMSRESVVQGIKQKIHGYDTGYGEAGIKDSFTPDLVKRPFLIPRAAGSISKKLEKVSSSSLSQKLYKAPDHMVEKIADYIKDASPTYSKALKDAIVNKDSYKKNAAIFALMQKPDFRNMIPAFFEQEESEEMPNE